MVGVNQQQQTNLYQKKRINKQINIINQTINKLTTNKYQLINSKQKQIVVLNKYQILSVPEMNFDQQNNYKNLYINNIINNQINQYQHESHQNQIQKNQKKYKNYNYQQNQQQQQQKQQYLNQQPQQQDDYDDLQMFKQQKRIQTMKSNKLNIDIFNQNHNNQKSTINNKYKSNNNNQNNQQSQFNIFYGKNNPQSNKNHYQNNQKQQQINEQQLQTKKLRAFNAAKYFQKIKLTYIKHIYNNSRQLNAISNKKNLSYNRLHSQFNLFLSLLTPSIIKKCHQIKNKNSFTIDDKQILLLMKNAFKDQRIIEFQNLKIYGQNTKMTKSQLIFKFASFLNCQIKKIQFFNIHNFVDESFYNLNYQKNEKGKRKSKKPLKLQDQIKNKIQRQIQQRQLLQVQQDFVDLNTFNFQSVSKNLTKTKSQINEQKLQIKKKSKKIQQIKKLFQYQIYQIFSIQQNKWKLFSTIQDHFQQIQIQWFKNTILHGLPIIGFYSIESLKPLSEYQNLIQLRKMDNIVIKDMSMYFADHWKKLLNRKRRVGVKPLMAKIFRLCNYLKPIDILQEHQMYQFEQTINKTAQFLVQNQIPKTKDQFNLNQYFLTPSRVGKYHILSPNAKPISNNLQFNQQKIYWKNDLVPVCSRMGWIDFSRMVRENEQPLKKTQNKNKKPIQLYRYEQTKPYQLPIDENDNFILDPEHNSIYIPPHLIVPEQMCIIKEKVTYICNKHKLRFAKLVQGFIHTGGMRVLPNEIGYIVYKKDKQLILKMYQQRMQLLNHNKQTRYDQKLQKMWRQVLKYVKLIDRMGGQLNR